jgi:gamma-glutamylcyclotransferase (GGCT)/AIG2-like uncharacterized protein YtfP
MTHHLFAYGTLRPHQAPPEIAPVVDSLLSVGTGTIRARLYDLGPYPGVVLNENLDDPTLVYGHVYQLPDNPEILVAALELLDAYEDFRPDEPAKSLYLRQTTQVTLADGLTLLCWVYTWNRPTPEEKCLHQK